MVMEHVSRVQWRAAHAVHPLLLFATGVYAVIVASASEPSCTSLNAWSTWSSCQSCPTGSYEPPLKSGGTRRKAQRRGVARSRSSSRIVGGEVVPEAEKTHYPFLAVFLEGFLCAGSLIGRKWILTAAHCVEDDERYLMGIGRYDINAEPSGSLSSGEPGVNIYTKRTVIHPNYDAFTLENDFALLELEEDVPSTWQIPILVNGVPGSAAHRAGQELLVLGWGVTSEYDDISPLLRRVSIPLIDDESCSFAYGDVFDGTSMLCVGLKDGGKDACYGDSGGPVLFVDASKSAREFGRYQLVGMTSWGNGCAREGYPGVFTDLTGYDKTTGKSYLQWIDEVTSGDFATTCPSEGGIRVRTRELDMSSVSDIDDVCFCTAPDEDCPERKLFEACQFGDASTTTTVSIVSTTSTSTTTFSFICSRDDCEALVKSKKTSLFEQAGCFELRGRKKRKCKKRVKRTMPSNGNWRILCQDTESLLKVCSDPYWQT